MFSSPKQVDAAAKDEEDGVLHGSGGARVTKSHERRKKKEVGENEKRLSVTIYKERLISTREK